MIHARAAALVLAALVPSPALREAMLGDLAELLAESGPHAFWRELASSAPSLCAARLAAADPLATVALALFAAAPLLAAEWLGARCLSLVPFKAGGERPLWFAAAAALLPAALAFHAARARNGSPPLWPVALAGAALAVALALPWLWTHRALAALIVAAAGALPAVERRLVR